MLKLIIDNIEVEVPKGTKVIDAAEKLGIMIPRFCYHPALGSVGACRVCAVKVIKGPVKGIQMSCMLEVRDGMIISSTDEEVVDFRKHVIELLMLNHPHDCPVCDEGGHCLLQDMTISGGHGLRKFKGNKRTHQDQDLGPLVWHEMNRCIQCYRCSRYYREYTGYNDLGVMGIGSRVYFGRQKSGTLESPFSGNLIDLCPTGVYTDKPSRFKGRRWDFNRTPSICINCSLGCNIVVSSRYREVVRQEPQYNKEINGYFICDRGRYGFYYANDEKRPRHAIINKEKASIQNAIEQAGTKLDEIAQKNGSASIACMGSSRNTLETQTVLKELSIKKGWRKPVFHTDTEIDKKLRTAVSRLNPELSVSLKELEKADFILAIGADPVNEAPMLALSMKQAQKSGAKITVIDPRPVSMPFEFNHLPITPGSMESCLGVLIKETIDYDVALTMGKDFLELYKSIICNSYDNNDEIFKLAKDLQKSQNPVIICGTEIVPVSIPEIAADIAVFLKILNRKPGLLYLIPGPNAFGTGLLSNDNSDFESLVSEIEKGNVRALIIAENNLFTNIADPENMNRILGKLEFFIVLDYINSKTVNSADIFIPTQTVYESGGIFINNQGHMQQAKKAFRGGIPIEQVSMGDHPPREFRHDIPGTGFIKTCDALSQLAQISLNEDRLTQTPFSDFEENENNRFKHKWKNKYNNDKNSMELILVDLTFGTEILSSCSPCLQELETGPYLFMHINDAAELGFNRGETIKIELDDNINFKISIKVLDNMAEGVMILPKYKKLSSPLFGKNRKMILKSKIRKSVNS